MLQGSLAFSVFEELTVVVSDLRPLFGKLFELSFIKRASEVWGFKVPIVEREISTLTSLLKDWEVDPDFSSRFLKAGTVAFDEYLKFLSQAITSQVGKFKFLSFEERVLYQEEPLPLSYQNADFIAYLKSEGGIVAVVLELTTSGVFELFYNFYHGRIDEGLSSLSRPDIFVPVNYLTSSFFEFSREISAYLNNLDRLGVPFSELEAIKFAQVIGYAISHKLDREWHENRADYYFIGVVSPVFEMPSGLFKADGSDEELEEILESLRNYYSKRRNLGSVSCVIEKLAEKETCELYSEELGSIKEVRARVERGVLESERGKLYLMVHPAGSGKTTSVFKLIKSLRERGERVFLFYFSPRKKINEDKREKFSNELGGKLLSTEREFSSGDSYSGFWTGGFRKGKLSSAKADLENRIRLGEDLDLVGLFSTIHSVARVYGRSTAEKVREMAKLWLEYGKGNGTIIVVVDELTGSEGGLVSLKDLIDALSREGLLNRTYLFGLDANLLCGEVVDNYVKWVEDFLDKGLTAPELLLRVTEENFQRTLHNYSSKTAEDFFGVPTIVDGQPAFIGSSLKLVTRWELLPKPKSREERLDLLVKKLADWLLLKGKGTFCYVQDREVAAKLSLLLESKGYRVGIYTAYSFSEDFKGCDFIIGTSSISRGIDVPFNKALIFIPSFLPEVQLGEVYQAVSRIRQGKGDEGEKEVDFVYIGFEGDKKEYRKLWEFRAFKVVDLAKEIVLSYFLKSKSHRTVVLPPTREHTGDEVNTINSLIEVERLTGVPVYSASSTTRTSVSSPDKPPLKFCYPFRLYRGSGTLTVSVRLLRKALSSLKALLKEEGVRRERIGELIGMIEELIRAEGRKLVPNLQVAVHSVLTETFKDRIKALSYRGKSVDLLMAESGIGFSAQVLPQGAIAFLLRRERSSCFGSVPKVPLESL